MKTFFQLIRYAFVGAVATIADYGIYYLLTRLFFLGVLTANPLSYLAGNIVSFLGHRFVTFRSTSRPLEEYGRFLVVTVVGLGISQLVVWGFLIFAIHDLVAKVFAVLISGLFNYLANRFWTFRNRK